jgi:hypothetical protein
MPSPTPTKTLAIALLAVFTTASHAESPLVDPLPIEEIQARYSDEQFKNISQQVCLLFDMYKKNPKAIKKSYIPMCKAPYEFVCKDEGEYLSMRGIVRSSINLVLEIKSPTEFENSIPYVVSELMKQSCSKTSIHYSLDTPFLKQRRNIAKRAIFLGNTTSFFDRFIFKEYSSVENGKRKTVIDINAVEYVDGQPETLLDYLDKILEPGHASRLGGSSRGDVSALRRTLIRYGAKRVSEMDCRNQSLFPCEAPEQGVASP